MKLNWRVPLLDQIFVVFFLFPPENGKSDQSLAKNVNNGDKKYQRICQILPPSPACYLKKNIMIKCCNDTLDIILLIC